MVPGVCLSPGAEWVSHQAAPPGTTTVMSQHPAFPSSEVFQTEQDQEGGATLTPPTNPASPFPTQRLSGVPGRPVPLQVATGLCLDTHPPGAGNTSHISGSAQ